MKFTQEEVILDLLTREREKLEATKIEVGKIGIQAQIYSLDVSNYL